MQWTVKETLSCGLECRHCWLPFQTMANHTIDRLGLTSWTERLSAASAAASPECTVWLNSACCIRGWLLTVDQGKLFWSYFILLATAEVLFCHLWDAVFGSLLLMCSYNSLAYFCRMIVGISTITDCGTLFILTLEATEEACAHVPGCAPGDFNWVHSEEMWFWNTFIERYYDTHALDQSVYTTFLLFDNFLQTLGWGFVQFVIKFLFFFLIMPMFAFGQGTHGWI